MKRLLCCFLLLAPGSLFCQQADTALKAPADKALRSAFTAGLELDLVPYISGGYYGSVWGGYKHFRYRVIVTELTMPAFLVAKGFSHNEVDAYALVLDYFFRPGFKGPWLGGGLEGWKGAIETSDRSEKAHYDSFIFTAGGGYVWSLTRNLYLNPWVGCHLRGAGPHKLEVGGQPFGTRTITPEASVKLGWRL